MSEQSHCPRDDKRHVIDVGLVNDGEMDGQVSVVNIGTLHVDKELFAKVIFKLLSALRHALEPDFVFRKFTHDRSVEKTVQI